MDDARVPFLDPIVGMAWAAAATSTIEIGSAIIILPQRNPVVLAKRLVSLDECSGGRIALGASVSWCKEEYDAIGADWTGRGKRMDEHIVVLRTLWEKDGAAFEGETIRFRNAFMYPKPLRRRHSDHPRRRKRGIGAQTGRANGRRMARPECPGRAGSGEEIMKLKKLTRDHDPSHSGSCARSSKRLDWIRSNDIETLAAPRFYLLASGAGTIDEQNLDARMAMLAERFVEPVRQWQAGI